MAPGRYKLGLGLEQAHERVERREDLGERPAGGRQSSDQDALVDLIARLERRDESDSGGEQGTESKPRLGRLQKTLQGVSLLVDVGQTENDREESQHGDAGDGVTPTLSTSDAPLVILENLVHLAVQEENQLLDRVSISIRGHAAHRGLLSFSAGTSYLSGGAGIRDMDVVHVISL